MKKNHSMPQTLPSQLFSVIQIRELEQIAIKECALTEFELMTRAGQAVFDFLVNHCADRKTIAVFCGSGNNAGDGFVVARLAIMANYEVKVYCLNDPVYFKGPALLAYQHYVEAGGTIEFFEENKIVQAEIIIDAILGTGSSRVVVDLFAQAIAIVNSADAYKIAIDIPSGLCANTGNVLGSAVKADITITFLGLKQGLFTGYAADYCGDIRYEALAIPDTVFEQVNSDVVRLVRKPIPKRSRCVHKGSNGHVLIIGGNLGYSGAACMAGEAAARVGAGLVTLATRKEHACFLNLSRPELMCQGVETSKQLVGLIAKASVIVLGPGLGQDDWAELVFMEAVNSDKPMVVDADGLSWLSRSPLTKSNWILTPHPGEAAKLLMLAVSISDIQADRYKSVRALQKQYGGVALLKGVGSLIASDQGVAVSNTGNPGMASGGMGDVLAGVIAGLLAQGFSTVEATRQGVYLHGLAGDLAVESDGERGLLASDLIPYLRRLVNSCANT